MFGFIDLITLFILTVLSMIILGFVAGFSPTLYIAQAAVSKSHNSRRHTIALMSGVLFAIVILLLLFQTFNLTTLLSIISSTIHALLISVAFNIITGLLFIGAGVHYILTRDTKKAYQAEKIKKPRGSSALFGFGFVKTFLSVSGATAVFIGGNIIGSTSTFPIERLLFVLIFLAATIAPFAAVSLLVRRKPDALQTMINKIKIKLVNVNYRLTVGIAAVIFGLAIVAFNIMMALFY